MTIYDYFNTVTDFNPEYSFNGDTYQEVMESMPEEWEDFLADGEVMAGLLKYLGSLGILNQAEATDKVVVKECGLQFIGFGSSYYTGGTPKESIQMVCRDVQERNHMFCLELEEFDMSREAGEQLVLALRFHCELCKVMAAKNLYNS